MNTINGSLASIWGANKGQPHPLKLPLYAELEEEQGLDHKNLLYATLICIFLLEQQLIDYSKAPLKYDWGANNIKPKTIRHQSCQKIIILRNN